MGKLADDLRRESFGNTAPARKEIDTNKSWYEQVKQALEPLDAKVNAGAASAMRMFGPAIPYGLTKVDELASKAVGAFKEPNNPMGRGDRPITPAWTPKTYDDIYKEQRALRDAEPEAAKAGQVVGDMARDYGILRGVGGRLPAGNVLRSNNAGGQIAQSGLTSPIAAVIKELNDAEDEAYTSGKPYNAMEGLTNALRNTVSSMTGGALGGMSTRRFGPAGGLLKHGELTDKEKAPIRAADEQNKNLPVNPNLHFGELANQAGQTEVAAKANRAMRDARGVSLDTKPSWVRSDAEWADLQSKYGTPPKIPAAMVDRLKERAQPGGFNETTRDIDNRLKVAEDKVQRGSAGTGGGPPLNLPLSGATPPGVNELRDRQHQLAQMEGRSAVPPIPANQIPGHSMNIWDRTMKGMPLPQQQEIDTLLAAVAPRRATNNINLSQAITERSGVKQDAGQYQSARSAINDAFPMAPQQGRTVNVAGPAAAAVTGVTPLASIGVRGDPSKTASKMTPGMVDKPLGFMDEIGRVSPPQTMGNVVGQQAGREGVGPLFENWVGMEDERRKRLAR
jgi:hypothetical protein